MKKPEKLPHDLFIVFVWIILTLIFALVPPLSDTLFRTLLGIPLVLFIPGYVLMAALYPGKDDLEGIERMALSLGMSLAVVPLLGLLLNFTFGLSFLPILLTLCIYSITFVIISAIRREKLSVDMRFSVPFYRISELIMKDLNHFKNGRGRILAIILVFFIILAAGMMYFFITSPRIGERFTEFYILDPSGKTNDYPVDMKYNSSSNLMVGVINNEYTPVNYTLMVVLDHDILLEEFFFLPHNVTWIKNVTLIPDKTGNKMKLEFQLYKENNFTAPYRELYLWVNVAG